DAQIFNPFTEIQVFNGHTNIVRFLVDIDGQNFASAGDDHLIFIWDAFDGRRQQVLDEHTRPLTCLSVFRNCASSCILLSAASDKIICLWNPLSGDLLRVLKEPVFTTRAFGVYSDNVDVFYSGGESLCMWSHNGELIKEIKRNDAEDVQMITMLSKSILIVTANRKMTVCESDETDLEELVNLPLHNEKITCVTRLNDSHFASGSLDGSIILWSSNDFSRVKFLSLKRQDFQGSNHCFPYSVQCLSPVDEFYVICAMNCGFYIQDIRTNKHLAAVSTAHYSKIRAASFVFDNLVLATSSEDGLIRLWGVLESIESAARVMDSEYSEKSSAPVLDTFFGTKDYKKRSLQLLGECTGHCGSVYKCLPYGMEGFMTCSADGMVILWKDGLRQ
ncbi:hypothetical protein CAPTEDRAFT_44181, partial [Capitella teleta]